MFVYSIVRDNNFFILYKIVDRWLYFLIFMGRNLNFNVYKFVYYGLMYIVLDEICYFFFFLVEFIIFREIIYFLLFLVDKF